MVSAVIQVRSFLASTASDRSRSLFRQEWTQIGLQETSLLHLLAKKCVPWHNDWYCRHYITLIGFCVSHSVIFVWLYPRVSWHTIRFRYYIYIRVLSYNNFNVCTTCINGTSYDCAGIYCAEISIWYLLVYISAFLTSDDKLWWFVFPMCSLLLVCIKPLWR